MTIGGPTEAKAFAMDVSDDQGRKPEYRRRLETVVVPAVNDADPQGCQSLCGEIRVYGLWG